MNAALAATDAQAPAGLPPVSRFDALAIMAQAEQAAIAQARGGPAQANPHAAGTRAHIIWEAHHGAVLLELGI